jgi:hypothetical protein
LGRQQFNLSIYGVFALPRPALLNFSGAWENICKLQSYLTNLVSPSLTLPHPRPVLALFLSLIFNLLKLSFLFFKKFPKFGKNEFGTAKFQLCPKAFQSSVSFTVKKIICPFPKTIKKPIQYFSREKLLFACVPKKAG